MQIHLSSRVTKETSTICLGHRSRTVCWRLVPTMARPSFGSSTMTTRDSRVSSIWLIPRWNSRHIHASASAYSGTRLQKSCSPLIQSTGRSRFGISMRTEMMIQSSPLLTCQNTPLQSAGAPMARWFVVWSRINPWSSLIQDKRLRSLKLILMQALVNSVCSGLMTPRFSRLVSTVKPRDSGAAGILETWRPL